MPTFLERLIKKSPLSLVQKPQSQRQTQDKPSLEEQTSYTGGSLFSVMSSYAGQKFSTYNPDKIPLTTYQEMKIHGQINAGLQFCILPIQSLSSQINCEDKDIKEATDKEIRLHYKDLIRKMLNALGMGFSPLEIVWEERNGLWGFKKFKDPDPTTIQINTDAMGNYNGFQQSFNRVILEVEKTFVFIHRLEYGNYYGIPRTKPAYPFWYASNLITLACNRYLEKKGDPPTIIRHPPDKKDTAPFPNRDRGITLGQQLKSGSLLSLPNTKTTANDYEWGVEYLSDDKRADMFLGYLKYLDVMMLRSIIVPERTFTQDTATGSYGMAETQTDLFFIAEEGLISDCEDAINKYVIPKFIKYNFGNTAPVATLKIAPLSKENRKLLSEIIVELIRSNKFLPDIEQIAKELKVPIEEEVKVETKMEAEERQEHIHLVREKFWRPLTELEQRTDLKGIDGFLDDSENKLRKDAIEMLGWMRDSAIRYLIPIIEKKDIIGINDFVLKYKNDYTNLFKTSLRNSFDMGVDSAVKEMKAKITDNTIPQKQIQWLNSRAVSITIKHTEDLQYKVKMTCLSGLDEEKTSKAIIFEVNGIFDTYINGNLETTIKSELAILFNKGRSLVVDTLKGFVKKV